MLTSNWSELPSDILEHLIDLLPLPDYHRFGVVCRNWCTVARKKQHPAQPLPWLVLGEDIATKKHVFFNLFGNKHYYMNIPELHGQFVCGSSYNWLFTADIVFNIRMLNPFTRKSYDLPPLKFLHNELPIECRKHDLVYKVILDHDPNERSDFTVMVLIGSYYQKVAFWRQGDSTWTLPIFHNGAVNDIIFFKEKFYALVGYIRSDDDQIFVIDIGPDSKLIPLQHQVPIMIRESYKYLVDFKGELLLIQWNREDPKRTVTDPIVIPNVVVYKLDLDEATYSECKHINNHAFIIGNNLPVVIDPTQFSGCIQNAIYFTHTMDIYCLGRRDLETYNMATKSLTRYYQFEYFSPLFVSPTWLAPNILQS